jgi:hypothetical protein
MIATRINTCLNLVAILAFVISFKSTSFIMAVFKRFDVTKMRFLWATVV